MADHAYMIATIDIKDYQTYLEQYGMPVAEMFAEAGAEVLVATEEADVLEGEWVGNWTVVVRLPSAEVAHQLYDSEKYAPFKKARIEKLTHSSALAVFPEFKVSS
ncbi:MAG: DUF1330 domain-containing protein [Halioglobus sp.]